jgi:hypothetical protein
VAERHRDQQRSIVFGARARHEISLDVALSYVDLTERLAVCRLSTVHRPRT